MQIWITVSSKTFFLQDVKADSLQKGLKIQDFDLFVDKQLEILVGHGCLKFQELLESDKIM